MDTNFYLKINNEIEPFVPNWEGANQRAPVGFNQGQMSL